jgi:hypothetical protein
MKFKQCSVVKDIIAGMESSKQQMISEGLWNDETTFEKWANFAGSHIEILEIPEEVVKKSFDLPRVE